MACEVEFTEWTRERRLRAPVFKRLVEEEPVTKNAEPKKAEPKKATPAAKAETPARELKLTNLDKVFFPDEKITKGDLIAYYRGVADVLVPHLRDRPITLVRYPDGINGKHFFQKQRPQHAPDWMRTASLSSNSDGRGKTIDYLMIDDADGLALDDQRRLHRRARARTRGRRASIRPTSCSSTSTRRPA